MRTGATIPSIRSRLFFFDGSQWSAVSLSKENIDCQPTYHRIAVCRWGEQLDNAITEPALAVASPPVTSAAWASASIRPPSAPRSSPSIANCGLAHRLHEAGTSINASWCECVHCASDTVSIGITDGRVEIVNVESTRVIFNEKVYPVAIPPLASPPGAGDCGTIDGTIKLIATADGTPILIFPSKATSPPCLAWSHGGEQLAAAYKSGTVHVWDDTRGYGFTAEGPRSGELAWAYYDRGRSLRQRLHGCL